MFETLWELIPYSSNLIGRTRIESTITKLIDDYRVDKYLLVKERPHHSRAFWNILFNFTTGRKPNLDHERFYLQIIEAGLSRLAVIGKQSSYVTRLLTDEDGFYQLLAELFVISKLPRRYNSFDVEVIANNKKDYDLHLISSVNELHIEIKWRSENTVFQMTKNLVANVNCLFFESELENGLIVGLNCNKLSNNFQLELGMTLEEINLFLRARNSVKGTTLDFRNISMCPDNLLSFAMIELMSGKQVELVEFNKQKALYLINESEFLFLNELIENIIINPYSKSISFRSKVSSVPQITDQAAESFGSVTLEEHDAKHPEWRSIQTLVESIYLKFPIHRPFNILFLGLECWEELSSAKMAFIGEPFQENGCQVFRSGLFDTESYNEVGVVVFFHFSPNGGVRADFLENPNCNQDYRISEEGKSQLMDCFND